MNNDMDASSGSDQPGEIKMQDPRGRGKSKTDHDVTGNEEAELQVHTDQSKIAIVHQNTPSSSEDKDSDDSAKGFDPKELEFGNEFG